MNQRKYIVFAVLSMVAGSVIYFLLHKITSDNLAKKSVTIIDYDNIGDSSNTVHFDGKAIFQSKCAACHSIFKDMVGPALTGLLEKKEWSDTSKLYDYIRHPEKYNKDKYIQSLRKKYGISKPGFPDLTNKEIDAIFRYLY